MHLACVGSGEEKITELATAVETNGSLIQGLASGAFFDRVWAAAPDAIDYLLAERSIRDVLDIFSDEHKRRLSAYIFNRALDTRLDTPRAQMIHQSFTVGGPVALAGVFYATIDPLRNVQNREVLDRLVSLDEPVRLRLFRQAGSFLCPRSMGSWLVQLLDRLNLDTKDLARLFVCLRTSIVPLVLFDRARTPSRTWGEDGEIADTPSNVLLVIQNEQRFSKALQELVDVGLASVRDKDIHVRGAFFNLPGGWGQSVIQWKEEAVRLVSHSFPKHKVHYEREYTRLCLGLLPVLKHVITYLIDLSLSQADMYKVAEACLSASCFLASNVNWRQRMIDAAQYVANRSNLQILAARVALRRLVIETVHNDCREPPSLELFPQEDRRSRAFSVEVVYLKARKYIERGHFTSAHDELSRCNATLSNSPFERFRQQEVTYMKAKVCRLQGQFPAARTLLADLVHHRSHLAEKATIHLSAVDCELGHTDQAIATLEAQLQHEEYHTITRSRLKLALADAQLMQVLLRVKDQRLSQFSHPSLCETYREYLAGLPTHAPKVTSSFGQIGVVTATAILAHLGGDFDTALAEWNRTLRLAQGRGPLEDYVALVATYSTNDLLLRRGGVVTADLENKVRTLSARTGRQYHFLGLGTTWPDILGIWQEDRGRDRLIADTL